MKKLALAGVLVTATLGPGAQADAVTDNEQDRAYTNCLIKRRVQLPGLKKEDSEFCLQEAGVSDPGEDGRKIKGKTWRDCLIGQASRLDDGVSPARDIGAAIVGLCVEEWREYVGSMWMNPSSKRQMANGIEKYAPSEGIQAVLLVRRMAPRN